MTDSQPDPREVIADAMQGWGLDSDWAADAILSALQQAGLKVLGREPTLDMRHAGCTDDAFVLPEDIPPLGHFSGAPVWRSMWDKA